MRPKNKWNKVANWKKNYRKYSEFFKSNKKQWIEESVFQQRHGKWRLKKKSGQNLTSKRRKKISVEGKEKKNNESSLMLSTDNNIIWHWYMKQVRFRSDVISEDNSLSSAADAPSQAPTLLHTHLHTHTHSNKDVKNRVWILRYEGHPSIAR